MLLEKITPLILTYNEAPNIARTLEQLRWARDIVIVDSFSDDDTIEIISGFPQVRVYQREFDSHAEQWTFGLRETGIRSDWILALDADYVLTDEFLAEIETLSPGLETKAFRARFIYCVNGKRLISGIYPRVSVLYRHVAASYRQEGHTQTLVVEGTIENLKAPILHDDRKTLSHWFQAQSRYTKLEANRLLTADKESLSWSDRVRRWRIVAPPAMLFYCLIIRAGILDGWAGFYYAFQRALAELTLSLHLLDHDLGGSQISVPEERIDGAEKEVPDAQLEIRNS